MCRKSLYFRGLRRLQEKWTEDAQEKKIDAAFGEYMDEMFETCDWFDFMMEEFEDTQKRLQRIADWEFDQDLFEGVIYETIDLITPSSVPAFDEPRTFEHNLFTPKAPIRKQKGMKARRRREHTTTPMMTIDVVVVV